MLKRRYDTMRFQRQPTTSLPAVLSPLRLADLMLDRATHAVLLTMRMFTGVVPGLDPCCAGSGVNISSHVREAPVQERKGVASAR